MITVRLWWFYLTYKGIKTAEIRKRFAKDFKGKIYEYVSKTNWKQDLMKIPEEEREFFKQFVGKVGLCFECDKVEEHRPFFLWCIEKETCLTRDDVLDYLDSKDKFVGNPKRQDKVYAIHITRLEIFNEPTPLSHFLIPSHKVQGIDRNGSEKTFTILKPLDRAPQSWCYIEI